MTQSDSGTTKRNKKIWGKNKDKKKRSKGGQQGKKQVMKRCSMQSRGKIRRGVAERLSWSLGLDSWRFRQNNKITPSHTHTNTRGCILSSILELLKADREGWLCDNVREAEGGHIYRSVCVCVYVAKQVRGPVPYVCVIVSRCQQHSGRVSELLSISCCHQPTKNSNLVTRKCVRVFKCTCLTGQ